MQDTVQPSSGGLISILLCLGSAGGAITEAALRTITISRGSSLDKRGPVVAHRNVREG